MVSSVRAVIGSVRRLRESAACWGGFSELLQSLCTWRSNTREAYSPYRLSTVSIAQR